MSDPTHTQPSGGPEQFDRDIDLKNIVASGVGLTLLIVVSMLLMWWLSVDLKQREVAADPPASPLAEAAERQLPPGPRLQGAPGSAFERMPGSPELELTQLRAEEDRVLTSYGWVNEASGVARIPIERAIELVLENGLPETLSAAPEQGLLPVDAAAAAGTAAETAPVTGDEDEDAASR